MFAENPYAQFCSQTIRNNVRIDKFLNRSELYIKAQAGSSHYEASASLLSVAINAKELTTNLDVLRKIHYFSTMFLPADNRNTERDAFAKDLGLPLLDPKDRHAYLNQTIDALNQLIIHSGVQARSSLRASLIDVRNIINT